MKEFFTVLWNFVWGMGLFGMMMIVVVASCALKEGLVVAATGFGAIFFLILFFGWDKIIGEEAMVRFLIAIVTGLIIAFFVWANR